MQKLGLSWNVQEMLSKSRIVVQVQDSCPSARNDVQVQELLSKCKKCCPSERNVVQVKEMLFKYKQMAVKVQRSVV